MKASVRGDRRRCMECVEERRGKEARRGEERKRTKEERGGSKT